MDECELSCDIDDSNPKSCKICCDMVYDMCIIDDIHIKTGQFDVDFYQNKFNYCIEKTHETNKILFSKRLNNHLRKDMNIYPGINEKYTFEHGSFVLKPNVLVLDPLDYIDCSETDIHSDNGISYIKIDYNEFTLKLKIGNIIIMHKDGYNELNENNHCTHAAVLKILDLDIVEDNKYGNYFYLKVTIPLLTEYFTDIDVDVPPQATKSIESKSTIVKNNKLNDITDEIMTINVLGKRFSCWLTIDGLYAVKQLDIRLCEHFDMPIQELIFDIRKNPSKYNHSYTKSDFDKFHTEDIRRMFNIGNIINSAINYVEDAGKSFVGYLEDFGENSWEFVQAAAGEIFKVIEDFGAGMVAGFEAAVKFGEMLFDGIVSLVKHLLNFLNGEIKISKSFGIWMENYGIDEEFTESVEYTYEPENKPYSFKFLCDGSLDITALITAKCGGEAGLIVKFSFNDNVELSLDKLDLYATAGIGFEVLFDFIFSAQLTFTGTVSWSKDKIFVIGVVPVLVTFTAEVSLELVIQSPKLHVGFHTGIGEYTRRIGVEYNPSSKEFEAYNTKVDTLSTPKLDFIFNIDPTSTDTCLDLGINPILKFSPQISLYKVITFGVTLYFDIPMSLEYPSTCDGAYPGYYCNSATNQKMGFIPVEKDDPTADLPFWPVNQDPIPGPSIYLTVFMKIGGSDKDTVKVLELLGIEGVLEIEEGPLFDPIELGLSSACWTFNIVALANYCCQNEPNWVVGEYTRNGAIDNNAINYINNVQSTVSNLNSIEDDTESFAIGLEYPRDEVAYHIELHKGNFGYMYRTSSKEPGYTSSSVNEVDKYWEFIFEDDDFHKYHIRNLASSSYDWLQTTESSSTNVFCGDSPNGGRYTWELEFVEYDDNDHPVFLIKNEQENKYLEWLNSGDSHLYNKRSGTKLYEQLFSIYPAPLWNGPASFVTYYIRNKQAPELFLGATSDGNEILFNDADSGRQRWIFQKIDDTFYKYRILYAPSNKVMSDDKRYLCINADKNEFILKDDWVDDRCKMLIERVSDTSEWFSIRPDCCSDDYLWKSGSNIWTTGPRSWQNWSRAKWKFELVDTYIDYPTDGQKRKIRNFETWDYLCVNSGSSNNALYLLSTYSSNECEWKFYHISDLEKNVYIICNQYDTSYCRSMNLKQLRMKGDDDQATGQRIYLHYRKHNGPNYRKSFTFQIDENIETNFMLTQSGSNLVMENEYLGNKEYKEPSDSQIWYLVPT